MAAKVDWDEIAGVLLEKRFYLTALELHTELLEGGRENRRLGDFFSNPGNFEPATPSSIARPSSDLCKHTVLACTCRVVARVRAQVSATAPDTDLTHCL